MAVSLEARPVTFRNDKPMRDTSGAIVDAHEPCVIQAQGLFWMYGTRYEDRTGFTPDNLVACYSSSHLEQWTYHGTLLPPFSQGLLSRPNVRFNQATGRYVLWVVQHGRYVVAVADAPNGPFEIVSEAAPVAAPGKVGDFTFFVDDDATGYIAYTTTIAREPGKAHRIFIERLADDFLSGTGDLSDCLGTNCESPALFRRGDTYYVLFDNTCCFCAAGTGARVYTAASPLGPFTYRGNCNRLAGQDPTQVDSPDTEPGSGRADCIIKAQQAQVLEVVTPEGKDFIWIGDRWHSADDGIKGHDYQFWTRLRFDDEGMIQPLRWVDRCTFTCHGA